MSAEEKGGLVRWNNTKGETAGFLGMNDHGGIVAVHGNDEEGTSPRFFAGANLFNGTGVVELIGNNGNTTFLTSTFGETPYLSLKNQTGQTVVSGTATKNGALTVRNEAGTDVFSAKVDSLGHGGFDVHSTDGLAKISGFVSNFHGNGELKLRQVDNSLLSVLGTISGSTGPFEGRPYFELRHPNGKTATNLISTPNDVGQVTTFNQEGFSRTRLSTTSAGNGYALLRSAEGSVSHFIGNESNGGPVIDLLNSDGNVIMRAEQDSTTGVGVLKTRNAEGVQIWQSGSDAGDGDGDGGGDGSTGDGGDTTSGLLGDLDNDGDVDFSDFITFASNFGKTITG